MDLSLDEAQLLLTRTFADFFSRECPSSLVREAEQQGFPAALWESFAALGATAMGLPENAGGLELGLLELCLVADAAGKVLAPLPFVEVASAGRLLAAVAPGDDLLEEVATGQCLLSLNLVMGAEEKRLVPWGSVAKHLLVLEGDSLLLCSDPQHRRGPPLPDVGGGMHCYWNCSDIAAAERRVLLSGDKAIHVYQRAVAEWKLLTAAALTGLAKQALAIGVDYANTREQFGVAIGGFQAIAHPLADCATHIDGAELLVWEAAWAETAQPQRLAQLCSMAFTFAAQTALQATSVSLHTHGGYGFTEEYDIQLYYRRALAWPMLAGGPRDELLKLASLRYDVTGAG